MSAYVTGCYFFTEIHEHVLSIVCKPTRRPVQSFIERLPRLNFIVSQTIFGRGTFVLNGSQVKVVRATRLQYVCCTKNDCSTPQQRERSVPNFSNERNGLASRKIVPNFRSIFPLMRREETCNARSFSLDCRQPRGNFRFSLKW